MSASTTPKISRCRACGAVSPAGVWLCECGQDLREPGSTLSPGEPFHERSAGSNLLRFFVPFFCGMLGGAGAGLLYAQTGDTGFFGRGMDVIVWTPIGTVAGTVLGSVVGTVLVLRAQSARKRR